MVVTEFYVHPGSKLNRCLQVEVEGANYYKNTVSKVKDGVLLPFVERSLKSFANTGVFCDLDVLQRNSQHDSIKVTVWEILTCGRIPYTGLPAMGLLKELQRGERLERPDNEACHDEV